MRATVGLCFDVKKNVGRGVRTKREERTAPAKAFSGDIVCQSQRKSSQLSGR